MSKSDRRWLLGFALAVLLLTSLPYLLGYQRQGEDWRFSGFVFGVEDGNSYIAKMLRGASGDWLFRTPYTASPQSGILAFVPYLLLGKLSAPPGQHDQLVAFFQFFRWLGGLLMCVGTFVFIRQFIEDSRLQRAATALAVLGGGLGWLSVFGAGALWGDRLPLEFYSPESFGFLSLFGLPHLAAARGLLLLGAVCFLRAVKTRRTRPAVFAGLLWLPLGFFQPLSVATGWAVLGTAFVINAVVQFFPRSERRDFWLRPLLITGLISAPPLAYNVFISLTDPFMQAWSRQNIILSPPPGDYLFAYAPALVLTVPGLAGLFRREPPKAALLLAWLVAFPFLAYAPLEIQRRLPEGIWPALVTAAVLGYAQIRGGWRAMVRAASFTAYLPAIILLAGAAFSAWKPAAPLFIPAAQARAYQYLGQNAPRDSVVLANFDLSNALPAWAAVRTITGHGPESIRAAEIRPALEQFFNPGAHDSARITLLKRFHIQYILAGPAETWRPANTALMTPIYDQQGYTIYQVQLSQP